MFSSKETFRFTISTVVPVYNSEATLTELVDRLHTVISSCASAYEVILVDDGSSDRSWQVIGDLAAKYPFVRGINLMRNYGQHNALLAGVLEAQYEIIVTIDDDLQHPPEEIPKLLTKLSEGYDIVYGKPIRRNHKIWRNISSKVLKTVFKVVLGAEMGSYSSSFRVFRSTLRQGFENFSDAQLALDVLLSWSADRVASVPVEHHLRRSGKSGYSPSKLMLLAFNMLIGYSTVPLRLARTVGLAASLLGFSMFFYVVVRRLLQTTYVPGFAFLASEIALFAGLQLFAIGIIGEYMARLHFRTMGKPPYVIREVVGKDGITVKKDSSPIQVEIKDGVMVTTVESSSIVRER
jgi:undecaprenyl-phosphate 4-deoxy-4-formamido-L-arabinose transferase